MAKIRERKDMDLGLPRLQEKHGRPRARCACNKFQISWEICAVAPLKPIRFGVERISFGDKASRANDLLSCLSLIFKKILEIQVFDGRINSRENDSGPILVGQK
jgi:hypothetical protein